MTFTYAQIACHRFGLGAKPSELDQVLKQGAKSFLLKQLDAYDAKPKLLIDLPSAISLIKRNDTMRVKNKKISNKADKQKARKAERRFSTNIYKAGVIARHKHASITEQSFNERLVYFWQNHFAISANKPNVRTLAASFENEAIRPYIMGNFSQMLLAVTKHPAMQLFLDNYKSVGPNSRLGKRRKKGLNENLAREILELHTLGVDNGYTQKDIIAFANMLTGWSVSPKSKTGFRFNKATHEPKPASFIGKTYKQRGVKQASEAIKFLARHKNTAQYIAKKLAQHFAGDGNIKLTKSLENDLEASFIKTGGDLKLLYKILIHHPACWQKNIVRFRTPNEWLVATSRAAQINSIKDKALIVGLKNMGQQPYYPGSPAGWPNHDKHWMSPSAFVQRWQVAKQLARLIKTKPLKFAQICFGEHIDEHSVLAMQKAPNNKTAISLFLLSEQMQFR
ncbi:MAG: DUF1800 domain-containing protein [Rhizobiales bacterium]|nr:DUF1800 domain-containing protein [Hyphomicrobiales bacterium]